MEQPHMNDHGNSNSEPVCLEDTAMNMDLSNWEFLTRNFDHDDIFDERSLGQPYASGISHSELSMAAATTPFLDPTYPNEQGNVTVSLSNFVSITANVDSTDPQNVHLPMQTINCRPNRYTGEPVNLVLEAAVLPLGTVAGAYLSSTLNTNFNSAYPTTNVQPFAHMPGMNGTNGAVSNTTSMSVGMHQPHAQPLSSTDFLESIQARRQELLLNSPESVPKSDSSSTSVHSHPSSGSVPSNSPNTSEGGGDIDDQRKPRHVPSVSIRTPSVSTVSTNVPKPTSSSLPKLCKPLKVYNYFYRDERDNIINGLKNQGDPLPPPVSDFSKEKYDQLLHQRWYVDPVKERRQHRKIHGKIDFASLSKAVAQRWRLLPEEGREFYRQIARADQEHYKATMLAAPQGEASSYSQSTVAKTSKKKKAK